MTNDTHKRAVSYKLSAPTILKLADLAAYYQVSVTVLIEMLVAERHAPAEIKLKGAQM